MNNKELVAKCIDIAKNYRTLYVMGCFGAPMVGGNVNRYCQNHSYNRNPERTRMIRAAANKQPPVYGFDCVCLIKGILWGWNGNPNGTYGGARYASNGVPDISADGMIGRCNGVSTTGWDRMVPGEAVWCSGHIGIYIGDGLAVECTPRWENCVQITAVANIGSKSGYNARKWTKHGKLPYITYKQETAETEEPQKPTEPKKPTTSYNVGDEVNFTGKRHYTNSNATNGHSCRPGKAKVTATAQSGKHPYHLIHTNGGGSTVYGWVNAEDISPLGGDLKEGCKVRVKHGAKTYNGKSLASFVYNQVYDVIEISGDRAVIGKWKAVTAAVKTGDLIVQ